MKLEWSAASQKDYYGQIDFLAENRSEKAAVDFIERVEGLLYIIRTSPDVFALINHRGREVKKAIVNNHITLFYQVNSDEGKVVLLRFWHNSQNPDRLSL